MLIKLQNYSNYILNNIDLTIDNNLVILGSNGAGKSTLAKILSGVIKSENVYINNINLNRINLNKKASLINYIPPNLDIFDKYITIKDYLELSNISNSINIQDITDRLNISYLLNKSRYSSGEAQLILVASALIHNAKITIFDEPTANLEPKRVVEIFNILKSDSLKTKIIITHDINLAHKLGYDILYLRDGNIEFNGSSKEFFKDKNLYNIFSNSVKRVGDIFVVNLI